MDIKIELSKEFKNYYSKDISSMISLDENEFKIMYLYNDEIKSMKYENKDYVYMPVLIMLFKDIIRNNEDNCTINFNNVVCTESIITSFLINEICNNSRIEYYEKLSEEDFEEIIEKENIDEIIEEIFGEVDDDNLEEFNNAEDEIYGILYDIFGKYTDVE